ncbi:hypothetical protein HDU97_001415 [Phlyctochytrium planicorne]|nr:hypothetical protein HDU97_001415 [Phlyctochytrium planicorne]
MDGRYGRYKAATKSFLSWLGDLVPTFKASSQSTNAIRDAAVAVVKQGMEVPINVIKQLQTAIMLRKEVAEFMMGTKGTNAAPDEGHSFFIDVLMFCHAALKPLVKSPTQPSSKPQDQTAPSADTSEAFLIELSNRFHGLTFEELEDVEFPEHVPSNGVSINSESVEWDEEWLMIMYFVIDLSEITEKVWATWKLYTEKKTTLMAATAVTNTSVTIISRLAASLELAYPHLVDWEHIFAVLYLDDAIDMVQDLAPKVTYGDAVRAVTMSIECIMAEQVPQISKEIMKITKLSRSDAELVIDKTQQDLQFALSPYAVFPGQSLLLVGKNGFKETHSLIRITAQRLGMEAKMKISIPVESVYGKPWDERTNLAKSLDELTSFLGADILPASFKMPRTKTLEYEKALMPLFTHFNKFTSVGKISTSLCFVFHILQVAILAVQGELRVSRLAAESMLRMNIYEKKLNDYLTGGPFDSFRSRQNLSMVHQWISDLNKKRYGSVDAKQRPRAYYNPWMAGQNLATTAYGIGIYAGFYLMDSVGQARVILHLYNALTLCGYMEKLPLLETLMELYGRSGSLWVGGKPAAKGQFMKGGLLSWGNDTHTTGKVYRMIRPHQERIAAGNPIMPVPEKKFEKLHNTLRGLDLKEPVCGAAVESFDFMCKQDFSKFPADVLENNGLLLDSVKAMVEKDRDVLGMDLIYIGVVFLDMWQQIISMVAENRGLFHFMLSDWEIRDTGKGWRESRENLEASQNTYLTQQILLMLDLDTLGERQTNVVERTSRIISEKVLSLKEEDYFIFKKESIVCNEATGYLADGYKYKGWS